MLWCCDNWRWCLPLQTIGVNSGEVGEDVEGKGIAARTPNYQIIANRWNPHNFCELSWMDTWEKIMTKHQKHIAYSSGLSSPWQKAMFSERMLHTDAYRNTEIHEILWSGILIENMIRLLCSRCIRSWFHVSSTHLYGFPISWALISWWSRWRRSAWHQPIRDPPRRWLKRETQNYTQRPINWRHFEKWSLYW